MKVQVKNEKNNGRLSFHDFGFFLSFWFVTAFRRWHVFQSGKKKKRVVFLDSSDHIRKTLHHGHGTDGRGRLYVDLLVLLRSRGYLDLELWVDVRVILLVLVWVVDVKLMSRWYRRRLLLVLWRGLLRLLLVLLRLTFGFLLLLLLLLLRSLKWRQRLLRRRRLRCDRCVGARRCLRHLWCLRLCLLPRDGTGTAHHSSIAALSPPLGCILDLGVRVALGILLAPR